MSLTPTLAAVAAARAPAAIPAPPAVPPYHDISIDDNFWAEEGTDDELEDDSEQAG